MTALQTELSKRGAVRPGASWPGWAGYAPTARGPEARRARAQAAGILETAPPTLVVVDTEPAAERELVGVTAAAERECERRHRRSHATRESLTASA